MPRDMTPSGTSEFLSYLAAQPEADGRLPALARLSQELGVSLATLREQLEVARALGLVDVRPGTGVRRRPYSFAPAVKQSLAYALALRADHFEMYSQLRNHIETAYWEEAVTKLATADKQELSELIAGAEKKLSGTPVQVPHEEHRRLHILIYSRLNNPFVTGLLEAYWDAYEAVGLNLYSGDIDYLLEVWQYHAAMVKSIWEGNHAAGREALLRHIDLLAHRRG